VRNVQILLAAAFLLLSASPGAKATANPLPADAARFIEHRELCDHFRGEPYDNDTARRSFIARKLNQYCAGADKALKKMKRKYSGSPAILERLNLFETCIESRSHCRPEAVGR
jgi:hypothetical protein